MSKPVYIQCNACDKCAWYEPSSIAVLFVPSAPVLSTFAFRCPSCLAPSVRLADEVWLSILQASGCDIKRLDLPAGRVNAGPALTKQDWVDFALGLGIHDYLSTVASLEMQP